MNTLLIYIAHCSCKRRLCTSSLAAGVHSRRFT
jgi:hypothetical protein